MPTATCPAWCTTDHDAERAQQARNGHDSGRWHRHAVGTVEVPNDDNDARPL